MVDSASLDKLQDLVPSLIERVDARDRRVVRVTPGKARQAFFACGPKRNAEGSIAWDGLEPPPSSDPLAWYEAAREIVPSNPTREQYFGCHCEDETDWVAAGSTRATPSRGGEEARGL